MKKSGRQRPFNPELFEILKTVSLAGQLLCTPPFQQFYHIGQKQQRGSKIILFRGKKYLNNVIPRIQSLDNVKIFKCSISSKPGQIPECSLILLLLRKRKPTLRYKREPFINPYISVS